MYFFHAPSPGLLDGGVRHFVLDGTSSTGAARVSLPFIVCSLKMPLAAKALISVNSPEKHLVVRQRTAAALSVARMRLVVGSPRAVILLSAAPPG